MHGEGGVTVIGRIHNYCPVVFVLIIVIFERKYQDKIILHSRRGKADQGQEEACKIYVLVGKLLFGGATIGGLPKYVCTEKKCM